MYLTPEQVVFFETHGYLVIEKFWDDATVDTLRTKIGSILDTLDLTDPRCVRMCYTRCFQWLLLCVVYEV